jgi:hypothetical protein
MMHVLMLREDWRCWCEAKGVERIGRIKIRFREVRDASQGECRPNEGIV